MGIEIKELIIKGIVQEKSSSKNYQAEINESKLEELKKSILEECKEIVKELIKEEKER